MDSAGGEKVGVSADDSVAGTLTGDQTNLCLPASRAPALESGNLENMILAADCRVKKNVLINVI
ncbi:hypothetical protein SAMN05421753_10349 [Planctomicrobium piriforme]|uniref:Uncharacterized protein n=1 Tax=Planctomicrobium piriforme TaxID=1576369 RepID=A0A1I3D1Q8_9PLAN|nr:hypothetical protein SAMN05421753_10349 [Planctomicrobium piriforme]